MMMMTIMITMNISYHIASNIFDYRGTSQPSSTDRGAACGRSTAMIEVTLPLRMSGRCARLSNTHDDTAHAPYVVFQ